MCLCRLNKRELKDLIYSDLSIVLVPLLIEQIHNGCALVHEPLS